MSESGSNYTGESSCSGRPSQAYGSRGGESSSASESGSSYGYAPSAGSAADSRVALVKKFLKDHEHYLSKHAEVSASFPQYFRLCLVDHETQLLAPSTALTGATLMGMLRSNASRYPALISHKELDSIEKCLAQKHSDEKLASSALKYW